MGPTTLPNIQALPFGIQETGQPLEGSLLYLCLFRAIEDADGSERARYRGNGETCDRSLFC